MTDLTREQIEALLDGATENAYDLEVVKWGGGIRCVYLNDYRVAGEKPWGGGDTTRRFKVRMADIMRAFRGTVQAAAPDLARALLDARAELAAAQQREAGLVERAEKAEAERDKWFEGAGAHHVASMQQAQRADIAEAELAASRARETALVEALVEQNELLRSAMQIAKREGVDGNVASTNWDAYYNRVAVSLKRHHDTVNQARAALAQAPTESGDGWTWHERLGWIGPDGKPAGRGGA